VISFVIGVAMYAQGWRDIATEVAKANNIHPDIVIALILVESSGNVEAENASGAVCLMGVVPMPGRPGREELLSSPRACIETGVSILRNYMDKTGSLFDAISSYNTGYGYWKKNGRNGHMIKAFVVRLKQQGFYGELGSVE